MFTRAVKSFPSRQGINPIGPRPPIDRHDSRLPFAIALAALAADHPSPRHQPERESGFGDNGRRGEFG